ncbi:MAG: branched-chain amino acid ABC transporter permease [Coriobacteriia bacterium]|nr:branched-chain amino acid ABC transporter permease [Coriobacteriia bacterium]
MTFEHVFRLTMSGLTVGMIYALIALGYTMVYGVLEFINFAHGEIFTIGGYIAITTLVWAGVDSDTSAGVLIGYFIMAVAVSVLLTALLGWLVERIAYRPLRGASRIIPLLSAIGVSIFLQNLIILTWGPEAIVVPTAIVPSQVVVMFGVPIRVLALIIIGVSVVLMAILTYIIRSTRIGKAMRATSQDMEAAEMMGIETNRTIAFTFIIGSALAAIGGFLVAMYYGSLKFDTGFLYGLKAFTAAVLGGIGNIPGAVVGSLLLGLVENYGVGMKLGGLAWFFVAGLALGLYTQTIRVPGRRRRHIRDEIRTPAYERRIVNVYRFPIPNALKVALGPRTDALVSVSARHSLRLAAGNLFLAVMAILFFLNHDSQFATMWQHAISFSVLVLVLMFRPSGILGEHIQEKV